MNEDFGYNTVTGDYYEQYTNEKIKEARRTFSRLFLGVLALNGIAYAVVFGIQIIMILAIGDVGKVNSIFTNPYLQWLFGIGPLYLFGVPAFYLITKNMKTAPIEKKKLEISDFFIYLLMCEGVMLVGNLIGNTLNGVIGAFIGHEVQNSTSDLVESSPIFMTIIFAVIIGPIIEEFIFRKMLISRLARYGEGLAIVVSAVAFGLFHGNLYQFFYATFLGLILGYVAIKTGNWFYTAIMHMIVNFIGSVLVLPIMKATERIEEAASGAASGEAFDAITMIRDGMLVGSYAVIQYAIYICGLVLIFNYFKHKKFKLSPICEYKIPRDRISTTVVFNVGGILLLILSLGIFGLSIFAV